MATSPSHRPALTNGTRRPQRIDGRSSAGKRLAALRAEALANITQPTPAQDALAARIAGLRFAAEQQEQLMASGDARFDHDAYLRTCTAWHRLSRTLLGSGTTTSPPKTLEDIARAEGWDLTPARPNGRHVNRFARGVLDQDDEARRVFDGNDDAPGIARNRKRDARLAKLATPPRSKVRRRRIRESKS